MPIARRRAGIVPAIKALGSQIHPVFMVPPLATTWFGAVLAGTVSILLGVLHTIAVFAGLYTAHVKDGYVDFYIRAEDDAHPLTVTGCRVAIAGATLLFIITTVTIGILVDVWAVALTVPGWIIGYLHAPQLDMHPVTATIGYPSGIALALVGGYYVQTQSLSLPVFAFAGIFLLVLSGIKVVDDAQDYEYDRSIRKRTVAVVLGQKRARQTAHLLMGTGLVAVVALAIATVFPPSTVLAPLVFSIVAILTRNVEPELATMILIRGSYLFLAVLAVAVWIQPFG